MQLTVVVMARPPVPGECKTRLAASIGARAAAELAAAMLGDVLDAAARLPAAERVLLAAPGGASTLAELAPPGWRVANQRGDDLGERLENAVVDLGASDRRLVVLGSDSPTLPVELLAASLERLRPGRVLLGPTEDGGYWVIGVAARELDIFRDVPWGTEAVYQATRQRCDALGLEIVETASWYDVDDHRAMERLAAEVRADPSQAPRCAAWLERRIVVPER